MDVQGLIHVTEVIKRIDRETLRSVLPVIDWDIFSKYPTKRFPSYVYKTKAFAHFGFFVDLLIRLILYSTYPDKCDISAVSEPELSLFLAISDQRKKWTDLVPEAVELTKIPGDSNLPNFSEWPKSAWSLLGKIGKDIKNNFQNVKSTIVFNSELTNEFIQGHPDLIWSGTIIDIKSISKPSTSCEYHLAQVAAYAMLKDLTCNNSSKARTNTIGLYYPLQDDPMVVFDISQWNSSTFGKYLKEAINGPNIDLSVKSTKSRAQKTQEAIIKNICDSVSESKDVSLFRSMFTFGLPLILVFILKDVQNLRIL
jgi:hypothetical protein